MPLDDPDNPLAVEIKQEAAAAYFSACHKMVDALDALKNFDGRGTAEHPVTPRSVLLENAAKRVYYVIIQREAMGFREMEHFFEIYEVPLEVRARLGPK